MNSPERDIVTMLDGVSSLGLTSATDLFAARMPDSPANCVCVYGNPGSPPMLTLQKSESAYFYSSVSVRVRNTDHPTGYAVMKNILDYLHGQNGDVIAGTLYTLIRALNDVQVLHWDKGNDRVIFFVNFEVQRRNN